MQNEMNYGVGWSVRLLKSSLLAQRAALVHRHVIVVYGWALHLLVVLCYRLLRALRLLRGALHASGTQLRNRSVSMHQRHSLHRETWRFDPQTKQSLAAQKPPSITLSDAAARLPQTGH